MVSVSALTLLVLLIISLGSSPVLKRIFHGKTLETDDDEYSSKNLEILTGSNRELISTIINDEHIRESLLLLQSLDITKDQRRKHNKMFIDSLAFIKGSKTEAFLWMKENLYQETCGLMLDDFDFSGTWLQITKNWFKDVIEHHCKCFHESMLSFFKRVKLTSLIYFDFLKDTCILIAMFYLLNETSSLFNVNFPSTLAWIFFASLTVPMLMSALETASSQPFAVLGQLGWEKYTDEPPSAKTLWAIRVAVVAFYLFIPAILTNNREDAREKRERLVRRGRDTFEKKGGNQECLHKSLRSTSLYIEESTKALLIFKTHELSIERIIQLTIQVTMVLLSPDYTKFPTNSGFQALFDQPPKEQRFVVDTKPLHIETRVRFNEGITLLFFILSIITGFLTTANCYVMIKQEEKKNFLPFLAKLVLGVRSLVVYATRMLCIITFFGVFLGLLNSLSHWRADQIPRADDELFTAPPYSNYTGHDIATAFGVFVLLLLVQALLILLLKRLLSEPFNQATWRAQFYHIIDSVNRQLALFMSIATFFNPSYRPDCFADWEVGGGSESEHRTRQGSVLKEIVVMILLHFSANVVLLYPVWVTGNFPKNGCIL